MRLMFLRFVCFVMLSIWVGGFTFYSAVVIPILHESLGSVETGYVTRRVTDDINAVGFITAASWWLLVWVERKQSDQQRIPLRARRIRLGLLLMTSAILLFLVGLHQIMDARLDSGDLREFYPLHRVYLIASTIQWFSNLGLMSVLITMGHDLLRRRASSAAASRSEEIITIDCE